MRKLLPAVGIALALGACNDQFASTSGKSQAPIPAQTMSLMAEKGMGKSDPILVRLYKKESELEVWKRAGDGRYALLKTYPICRWSGQLGPKRREGDRQAPEGFYTVTPGLMNPNSSYYLSFDTGYPNSYDRAHGGTGSQLMVHGSCSSRGCFAMTDEGISEVYALAREAFAGGQRGFQLQAMPFRMTAENLAKHRFDANMPFWRNLKEGSDNFEVTKQEPKVAVCGGRYAFNTVNGCAPDPGLAPALAARAETDRRAVAELIDKGVKAVKITYSDGSGHESFRTAMTSYEVSRPEALASGPNEIEIDALGRTVVDGRAGDAPARKAPATRLAAANPVTTGAVPAPAKGSRIVVASADPDAVAVPAPRVPDAKPFYERMVGSVLGGNPEPEPTAATPVQAAPSVKAVAPATVPPKRLAATAPKSATTPPVATLRPTVPPLKPQAAVTGSPQKRAEAGLIPGSQAIAPAASGFQRSN